MSKFTLIAVTGFLVVAIFGSNSTHAAPVRFSGELGFVAEDIDGIYVATAEGTRFTGFVDDETFDGQISDGTTTTVVTCCQVPTSTGIEIVNNAVLGPQEVGLLNALAGFDQFTSGQVVDRVNIESDGELPNGGRIEVGLIFVLDSAEFANESQNNYPIDPMDALFTLFSVLEEDANGMDIYEGFGQATVVPLPAGFWLILSSAAILFRLGRRSGKMSRL